MVVSPTHLVLVSVRGWVNPRTSVRPEEWSQWKIPMTWSGIQPATFWLVLRCLKQLLLYRVPQSSDSLKLFFVPPSNQSRLQKQLFLEINSVSWWNNKGKVAPLQTWTGPEGSRKLRFPDFVTTAQDGGKVVNLTHRLPFPPENTPGTHFC